MKFKLPFQPIAVKLFITAAFEAGVETKEITTCRRIAKCVGFQETKTLSSPL